MKLDIGCGSRKVAADYIGLDVLWAPCVDVVASVDSLPFRTGSLMEIYSRRCLMHIKNDGAALNEIFRVLHEEGKVRLIVSSWYGWLFYWLKFLGRKRNYETFHLYTFSKLRNVLSPHPFAISKIPSHRGIGYDIAVEVKQ